jgi:dienelactone hydrolase
MRALVLLLLLVAAPAWAETVTIPGPDGVELRARLLLPEGAPAIVALHGCGGPYPQRDAQWGEVLRRHGHIVLFPDSFGSRGLGSQCREQRRTVTAAGLRRRDALAAAQWLHDRPGTPPGVLPRMRCRGAAGRLAAGGADAAAAWRGG